MGAGGGGEKTGKLKASVVHILNAMLVCWLLIQPPHTLHPVLGKTVWETEAGVWKPRINPRSFFPPFSRGRE